METNMPAKNKNGFRKTNNNKYNNKGQNT